MKKALLIDADKTLRFNRHDPEAFINKPEDIQVPEIVLTRLREARENGLQIAIISNQAGVEAGHTNLHLVVAGFATTMALCHGLVTRAYWCTDRMGTLAYQLHIDLAGPVATGLGKLHVENPELVGQFRKPGAGMGLCAMEDMLASPEECWYVGDMETDQEFAKNLGIDFMWARDWWAQGLPNNRIEITSYPPA